MRVRSFVPFLVILSLAATALAGTDDGKAPVQPIIQDQFAKGMTELEILGGYSHSPITTGGSKRPEFDFSGVDIRYGIVLSPMWFDSSKILRGDFEFLVDGFADGVTKGPGNYLAGGEILFRYNFVQPGSKLIPYFQLGGGGLHSDAAEVPSQRIIGGDFEFILQADLGARLMLNDRWSLLFEGTFQHISNADTAARNVGVNALGGRVGLGYIY